MRTHRSAVDSRRIRGAVVAVLAVVVGSVVGGLGLATALVLGPEVAPAAAAPATGCTTPVSEGDVRVVVVVDPGDGGPTSAVCLVVPRGTTGSQVLARRASMVGAPVPRYGSSGLLCAIDGHPTSGCGERGGVGFRYWAYFNGASGDWSYGNYNPFTRRVADGDIEGWRFVEGAGNGTDPPPRLAPSPSLFPALLSASAGSSAGSPAGSVGPATTWSGSVSSPAGDGAMVGADTPVTSAGASDGSVVGDDTAVELAGAPLVATTTSRPWLPVVIVVVVMVVLAAGAVVRMRARP